MKIANNHLTRRDKWLKAICASPDVEGNTLLVALAFATEGSYETGENFYQKNATIGAKTGLSREVVNRHMRKLVKLGWLLATGERLVGGIVVYRLAFPATDPVLGQIPF